MAKERGVGSGLRWQRRPEEEGGEMARGDEDKNDQRGGRRSFGFLWFWPGEGRVRVLDDGWRLGSRDRFRFRGFFLYFFNVLKLLYFFVCLGKILFGF